MRRDVKGKGFGKDLREVVFSSRDFFDLSRDEELWKKRELGNRA